MKNNSSQLFAKLALVAATLIWGSSFIIVEDVVDGFPTFALLAIRFIFAAVLLGAVFFKRFKKFDLSYLGTGMIFGMLLFIAYAFQTFGIAFPENTPGKNAFLTAVYCVIVPFLVWLFDKKRPDIFNFIAAFVCIVGIGFVSLTEDFTVGMGDALTLVGGLFYAFHIIAVSKLSKGKDIFLLTVFQFASAGALALLSTVIMDVDSLKNVTVSTSLILSIAYLSVCCTAIALLFQNIGQKLTDASTASILLSLESVFGIVFSLIMGRETLDLQKIIGFILIFSAVIISETKLEFLFKRFGKKKAL